MVIVNRDINTFMSKIIIEKNGHSIQICPFAQDYCIMDVEKGDSIKVAIKFFNNSKWTLASFIYENDTECFFITTTNIYRIWSIVTYTLSFLCIFLLTLKQVITISTYEWLCTGFVLITALSIILLKSSLCIYPLRKKIFTLVKLGNLKQANKHQCTLLYK